MLTAQILSHGNPRALERTVQSIKSLNVAIQVASTCDLAAYCKSQKIYFEKYNSQDASAIRNSLVEKSKTEWNLYLHAGEVWVQGVPVLERTGSFVTIMHDGYMSKEIRLWKKNNFVFENPIFEYLKGHTENISDILLTSSSEEREDRKEALKDWKASEPLNPRPYYYEGLDHLANGRLDEFLKCSEKYMFMDTNKQSVSSIMNRYYYALGCMHKKDLVPAMQNLSICLATKPTMAEFWCLGADLHFYLTKKYKRARSLYQNALVAGSRRLKKDTWPMEIAKYREYPEKMIAACETVLGV